MQGNQFFRARLRPDASRRIAIIDKHIAAFKPTKPLERLPKSCQTRLRFRIVLGQPYQYTEPLHSIGLLRSRRNWPRSRASQERDELAPSHSITSSARVSSVAGASMPSTLAALRLITSSNLVGCTMGKSAGLAPLRTLPI